MTNAPVEPIPDGTGIPDVPDVSAEWYRRTVESAAASPEAIHVFVEVATDAVAVVLAAMLVAAWWRARTGPPLLMARVLLVPAVTVVAYLLSETAKELWQEERPCRTLGDLATIAACPEYGDWSFPSNHATVAAAAAVALAWAGGRLAFLAIGVALFAAASRVVVGVHYPHDVIAGFLLGAVVALVLPVPARLLAPVITQARNRAAVGWLVGDAGAGDAPTVRLRRPTRLRRHPRN
ncbi:phosphatase PAP2 family protein [Pseudonocardia xinjiangensis]|uniref:phosphatase PAP2 family protein n=1 Tax=Pseudonocardia xinjiangensis TaxID=75289 RepID=UPI003D937024